jgi:FixJ family two-component response regulator
MRARRSLIVVVDDDLSVRESLPDLLRELGFGVRAFESAPSAAWEQPESFAEEVRASFRSLR